MQHQMLTIVDLARLLQVSPMSIWRMRRDGQLPPGRKVRRCVRWALADVQHLLGTPAKPEEGLSDSVTGEATVASDEMQLRSLESLLASSPEGDDNITLGFDMVDFCGQDFVTAVLLKWLIDVTQSGTTQAGWIVISDTQLAGQLRMSNKTLRRARKQLESMAVVETMVRKHLGAPTMHYRIDSTALMEKWTEFQSSPATPA